MSDKPCIQVSTEAAGTTPATSSSQQLKFGVERILSEDIYPSARRAPADATPSAPSRVPCSECVTSLFRCCRISPDAVLPSSLCAPYHGYYGALHSPRPLRPFTNVLVSESLHANVGDRGSTSNSSTAGVNKRKRSWSRAVFSNLQRKGLEKRFQIQKYITKPDRRQLAATLGLTDAQVKVWFQNRRMKWRHSKEVKQSAVAGSGVREEQGRPDSTQEPEVDVSTVDS